MNNFFKILCCFFLSADSIENGESKNNSDVSKNHGDLLKEEYMELLQRLSHAREIIILQTQLEDNLDSFEKTKGVIVDIINTFYTSRKFSDSDIRKFSDSDIEELTRISLFGALNLKNRYLDLEILSKIENMLSKHSTKIKIEQEEIEEVRLLLQYLNKIQEENEREVAELFWSTVSDTN